MIKSINHLIIVFFFLNGCSEVDFLANKKDKDTKNTLSENLIELSSWEVLDKCSNEINIENYLLLEQNKEISKKLMEYIPLPMSLRMYPLINKTDFPIKFSSIECPENNQSTYIDFEKCMQLLDSNTTYALNPKSFAVFYSSKNRALLKIKPDNSNPIYIKTWEHFDDDFVGESYVIINSLNDIKYRQDKGDGIWTIAEKDIEVIIEYEKDQIKQEQVWRQYREDLFICLNEKDFFK
jgi:hypothetical protein